MTFARFICLEERHHLTFSLHCSVVFRDSRLIFQFGFRYLGVSTQDSIRLSQDELLSYCVCFRRSLYRQQAREGKQGARYDRSIVEGRKANDKQEVVFKTHRFALIDFQFVVRCPSHVVLKELLTLFPN